LKEAEVLRQLDILDVTLHWAMTTRARILTCMRAWRGIANKVHQTSMTEMRQYRIINLTAEEA